MQSPDEDATFDPQQPACSSLLGQRRAAWPVLAGL